MAAREPEVDVALLVSCAPPAAPGSDAAASAESITLDEEAWEDLGFEHGFEWVDVDARAQAVAEDDRTEGLEEEGIGRVVAALHAHMWNNMVPVNRQTVREEESGATDRPTGRGADPSDGAGEDDDEAEFATLGAPPLPELRPFVPIPVTFPTTMLPSLARKTAIAPDTSSPVRTPLPPLDNSTLTSPTPTTCAAAASGAPAASFENDFAPFVPTAAAFDPDEFGDFSAGPATALSDQRGGFEPSEDGAFDKLDGEGADEDGLELSDGDDGLSELVAKLKEMREEARGMGLEERRAMAERAVLGLLGE